MLAAVASNTSVPEEIGMGPLEGVRVLDLSNLLAGPLAATHLGDFGAEVIKVEHPARGDEMRRWGHQKDGIGLYWKIVGRNKKLITLDLSRPEGRDLARDLAARSDVVIENFRTGTLESWGLGYSALAQRNPGLVMAHVTGYGQTGPYAARAGFGSIADGFAGYASITGFPDRPPLLASFGLSDASTAIFTAFAIMVALRHRDRTGQGQEIDAALYEGLFTLIGCNVIDYDQLGAVQLRDGSRLPFVAPRNTFRTKDDKWIAIAGSTQSTFERLAKALGIPHVLRDPRFTTNQDRLQHAEELEVLLQSAISTYDRDEVLALVSEAGAAAGPVYDIVDIVNDAHYASRENIVTVDDEDLGPIRMQGVVPHLAKTPGHIRHAGGKLGRDNEAIYGEVLGLDTQTIAHLAQSGVI